MIVRLLAVLPILFATQLFGASTGESSAASRGRVEPPKARAEFVAEHLNIAPGKRAWLALHFTIEPGWHMYWKGQNDSGLPPQLEFELPTDYKVGEVLWPAPERHVGAGDLVDSIVEEQLTLLVGIDVPVEVKVGADVRFGVKAEWLVCQEACILERTELSLSLPVRVTTPAVEADPKSRALFAAARERLPRRLPKENPPATIKWQGAVVMIEAPGSSELVFHSSEDGAALVSPLDDGFAKGSKLELRIREDSAGDRPLLGVLEIHKAGKKPEYFAVSLPRPAAVKPAG